MYWFVLKSILGSIIGSSFYNWFKNTKSGRVVSKARRLRYGICRY